MVPALLVRFGLGLTRGIVNTPKDVQQFIHKFRWLIVTSSTLGAAIDIVNTIALCIAIERNYSPLLRKVFLLPLLINSPNISSGPEMLVKNL